MRTLQECHEVIMRAIGQAPTALISQPPSGIVAKLNECLNGDGLTGWEIDFLSSIDDTLSLGWSLTANQQDTLDKIWRERT